MHLEQTEPHTKHKTLWKINFYYKEVTKVPDCMHTGQEKMARESNSNSVITVNNQLRHLTKHLVHAWRKRQVQNSTRGKFSFQEIEQSNFTNAASVFF